MVHGGPATPPGKAAVAGMGPTPTHAVASRAMADTPTEPPTDTPADAPDTPADKPPFVAGLPDGPLDRPSDFPDYDGPLVCPFYGPDHPARRNEESKKAFNEEVARVAFGDEAIDRYMGLQGRDAFCGDWWFLAGLRWGSGRLITLSAEQWQSELAIHAIAWNSTFLGAGVVRHLERVNLKTLDLRHAMLERAHLEYAVLDHARLGHAHMNHAHLTHAHMLDTHLEAAQLFGADLSHAHLGHAHLTGTLLACSQMEHSYLSRADATHANFRGAVLASARIASAKMQHADLTSATLNNADLRGTDFSHAKLSAVSLAGSSIYAANFDNANLRWSRAMLFDDNAVQRLDIEGNAPDPWSTLRRTYTGPMFFVHLLLLVAFLLPYAAKVLTLTTTARGYEALRQSLEAGEGVPPGADVVRAWLVHFDASHTDTHAWWVLLGGTHAWWWALVPTALAILCYNVLRGHLTLTIGVLRDQADRVERTPTLVEYYGACHPLAGKDAGVRRIPAVWWRGFKEWRRGEHRWNNKGRLNPLPIIGPWRLHQLARVLFWISIASVILHVGSWLLTTTVPVPK
ncbi:hypothetical protein AY599_06255 [Leptolyngbya valderiana BDU 20041]|nr:hypothetical protein AY599_06255 [Leptolyngbya valderiana BDU 20041]